MTSSLCETLGKIGSLQTTDGCNLLMTAMNRGCCEIVNNKSKCEGQQLAVAMKKLSRQFMPKFLKNNHKAFLEFGLGFKLLAEEAGLNPILPRK